MKYLATLAYLVLALVTSNYTSAQSGSPGKKKSQAIPIDQLKNAKQVEDLIALFPADVEIVSCRISIVGKDIKYTEHVLLDHNLNDLFKNVHAGHWIYIEYILVKKKGVENKTSVYDPIELIITH